MDDLDPILLLIIICASVFVIWHVQNTLRAGRRLLRRRLEVSEEQRKKDLSRFFAGLPAACLLFATLCLMVSVFLFPSVIPIWEIGSFFFPLLSLINFVFIVCTFSISLILYILARSKEELKTRAKFYFFLGLHQFTTFVVLFLFFGFAGIIENQQNNPFQIQNDGTYLDASKCPEDARVSIEKYQIDKQGIVRCQIKKFNVDNRIASLVHITYGAPQECMPGCAYSYYCAIVEGGQDYPYVLSYINPMDNILNNASITPRTKDHQLLTGRAHWLTSTQEFKNFIWEDDGFRRCLW
jgi:hypothetical protein